MYIYIYIGCSLTSVTAGKWISYENLFKTSTGKFFHFSHFLSCKNCALNRAVLVFPSVQKSCSRSCSLVFSSVQKSCSSSCSLVFPSVQKSCSSLWKLLQTMGQTQYIYITIFYHIILYYVILCNIISYHIWYYILYTIYYKLYFYMLYITLNTIYFILNFK